jgi:O-succinylhomoserine sulfhydrylase
MTNPVSKKYTSGNIQNGFCTQAVRGGYVPGEELDQSPPLHLTSAFHYESADHADKIYGVFDDPIEGNDYSRTANPTNLVFEKRMALLEKGEAALAAGSGQHAAFLALMSVVSTGDHIVCSRVVYGNTIRLIETTLTRFGISVTFADPVKTEEWEQAIQPNTRVFFLESPTNPTLDVADIKGICTAAKRKNITTIVDNTIATPAGQQPIPLGADIVMHSATKYIDGQGRCIGGVIISTKKRIEKIRAELLRTIGGCLSPFHSWIFLKGLETLKLRVEKHSENALIIAKFLEEHPKVKSVRYPFHPSHPQYALAKQQQTLGGGLLCFSVVGDIQASKTVVDSVKMISLIGNLGDTQTIIGIPGRSSHSRVSEKQRIESGITDNLIRLSVGLEDAEDIIKDLDQSLSKV